MEESKKKTQYNRGSRDLTIEEYIAGLITENKGKHKVEVSVSNLRYMLQEIRKLKNK